MLPHQQNAHFTLAQQRETFWEERSVGGDEDAGRSGMRVDSAGSVISKTRSTWVHVPAL